MLTLAVPLVGCRDDAIPVEDEGATGSTSGHQSSGGATGTSHSDESSGTGEPDGTEDTGMGSSDTGSDPEPATILITEIMYHPVLEEAFDDHHEFVELYNPGEAPIAVDGWKLRGGIDYVFPPGTELPADGFLVVAKDPAALLAIPEYGLGEEQVVGPFDRELDNGDDSVILAREDDSFVDGVAYRDEFPWPIAADALGAGESWLRPELLPLTAHQYRGVSLERVSLTWEANDVGNWEPSAVDAPSPGQAYAGLRDEPRPILIAKQASTASPDPLIRAGEPVTLELEFSEHGSLSTVSVEYFVDDVQVVGEPVQTIEIPDGDFVGRTVSVPLPGQADDSIVRYRVLGDRGDGIEVISPRPSDPHDYHAYFVSPVIDSSSRVYQLFLASDDWTQMWTNIQGGREIGCDANPTWNDRVPGVFVYEGEVHDVQVRYQGSRWNRGNGPTIDGWTFDGPAAPAPLRGLSYRIAFPRYHRFEEHKTVTLNKLTQGCPGLSAAVGFELFRRLDIPSPTTRFVRFHVNGGFLRTMLQIERPGKEMMESYHQAIDPLDPDPVGHLYKSVGLNANAGPYGWGDARPLQPWCGHDAQTRYAYTYDRKTRTWADHDPLIAMIEQLDGYRDPFDGSIDVAATQAYLEANFDVDLVLDHIAVMNWSVPFDDYFQNHFLYQRRGDSRWIMMPWDLDRNFGPWAANTGAWAQASIFGGRNGIDAVGGIDANRSGWWNRIKDSVLRTYEPEFIDRIKLLSATTLHPEEISLIVDSVVASYDIAEANAAASPPSCDILSAAADFNAFAQARHDYIVNTPASELVDW